MAISFDKVLGIHEEALNLRAKRAEILATNLVNADTPNYKARDIDFRSMLRSQMPGGIAKPRLAVTNSRDIAPSLTGGFSPQLLYRVPLQPSLDGNTVEEQVEMSKYAENNMAMAATLNFINSKFKGLTLAITGGQG